jgi:hypothetical protein
MWVAFFTLFTLGSSSSQAGTQPNNQEDPTPKASNSPDNTLEELIAQCLEVQDKTKMKPTPKDCRNRILSQNKPEYRTEPVYCSLKHFKENEVPLNQLLTDLPPDTKPQLKNIHAFKLGDVTLVGVGVGKSDPNLIKKLAKTISPQSEKSKYCTWFLNKPKKVSPDVETALKNDFIWKQIKSNPAKFGVSEKTRLADEFTTAVESSFTDNTPSFLSCAKEAKYLAMGCNGMKHRGPSVLGMVLAYSGCSTESALRIVNSIWGQNGVEDEVRRTIIEKGYQLGNKHPESRKELELLLTKSAQP